MIWLHPAAAIALLAVALPILIHVLVRQRATRVRFPTLRFIQPHRLSSVKRHALEDFVVLAVRVAIVSVAAAAIAGPLIATAARHRMWDSRTMTAEVAAVDPRLGLARAIAWLDRQPPGRREIVVRGPLLIGTLSAADIAAIPAPIGIRFERAASVPVTRTVPASPVAQNGRIIQRAATLSAERTSVRDVEAAGVTAVDIQLVAPPDQQAAVDQLRRSFQTERVAVPLPDRAARVTFAAVSRSGTAPRSAWMADAAAQIAREVTQQINFGFASDGNRLLVATDMPATDARAMTVLRAVARSLGERIDRPADEIVPIPDAQLATWTRQPGPATVPPPDAIERDDRRWLWGTALLLLAVEAWLRRSRNAAAVTRDSQRAA